MQRYSRVEENDDGVDGFDNRHRWGAPLLHMGGIGGRDGAPNRNDDAGERVAGIVDWVQDYREAGTVTLTSRVPSSVVESP